MQTIRYVAFGLQKARISNTELEYIFYLQLKQIFNSSLIYKGKYQKDFREYIQLSETTISTNMKRLVNRGFAQKIYKSGKCIGYKLQSYLFVYKNIFHFNDNYLKLNTVKLKAKNVYKKKRLKEQLEEIEISLQGCRNISKGKGELSDCKQSSPGSLEFQLSCSTIAQVISRKSSSTGHKIASRMVRKKLVSKTLVREEISPLTLSIEQMAKIKMYGGKKFFDTSSEKFLEQKSNLYTFLFTKERLSKTFYVDTIHSIVYKNFKTIFTS